MPLIFADTGYWQALTDRRDFLHARAREIAGEAKAVIVTSELVLTELLNAVAEGDSSLRLKTAEFVEQLRHDPQVRIVPMSTAQFQSALISYRRFEDKEWSLVDCASFLIMRQHRITDALTHDRHFLQAGYRALLRE